MAQLVKRRSKVYIRKEPEDYKKYQMTGDFSHIHPNKLKTWLAFAESAVKARDGALEDVVESVIENMSGKKFKKEERKVMELSKEEILNLKIQALNKGIPPEYVDILAKPKKEERKRYEKILQTQEIL